MGPPRDARPQGEDCLNLTIAAPARGTGARPVLVWFHGGGFSSGAGLMDWYDGGVLAAEGDVVVVGINHRLGALGYLCLDGVSEGNLGLCDQLEALRWVHGHIAEYGGDPGDVTVIGQSAGGISVRLLMELPAARGLFRRAVLQSTPLGFTARPREESLAMGRTFADALGDDPRTAGVPEILAAQRETALATLRRTGRPMEPAFVPAEDTGLVPSPGAFFDENVRGLDVLYGWNADDMTAFWRTRPPSAAGSPQGVRSATGGDLRPRWRVSVCSCFAPGARAGRWSSGKRQSSCGGSSRGRAGTPNEPRSRSCCARSPG
ncbi:carboxylesterase family protein [Streptomyces sp. NPDC041068]|uniref:carboxylesterase family protein n=1 Tax=Streptomyces sp. NPDC041068 TaxID=3155130 RepID=UPI0033D43D2E